MNNDEKKLKMKSRKAKTKKWYVEKGVWKQKLKGNSKKSEKVGNLSVESGKQQMNVLGITTLSARAGSCLL